MFLLLWSLVTWAAEFTELQRACRLNKVEACLELAVESEKNGDNKRALEWHQEACQLKEAQSCFIAGYWLFNGKGASKSIKDATAYYRAGCSLGHGAACVNLGVLHVQGDGGKVDLKAAAAYFSQACEVGDKRGCTHYGIMLLRGQGVKKNLANGVKLLDVACQVGDRDACASLRQDAGPLLRERCEKDEHRHCYNAARFSSDASVSLALAKKGCVKGYQLSCVKQAYHQLDTEPKQAVKYFKTACDSGVGEGCFSMALAHLEGRGVKRSETMTRDYMDKACLKGDLRGCEQAGILFRRIGNLKTASARLQKGCDGGRVASCAQLGFLKAKAGKQAIGAGLFSKACIGGHAQACFNLAVMMHKGQGIKSDPIRANLLMKESCRLGAQEACRITKQSINSQ